MLAPKGGWAQPLTGGRPLRRLLIWGSLSIVLIWAWFRQDLWPSSSGNNVYTPLVEQMFSQGRGDGGRWYIPPSWTRSGFLQNINTPAEAAQVALELCIRKRIFLDHSKIPLVIHQGWKTSDSSKWSTMNRQSVETWLEVAMEGMGTNYPHMAYVYWDDDATDHLIRTYEPGLWEHFQKLPHGVEKADIFRVVVLKWFGGVYVDIDAVPIQHPAAWVQSSDIKPWKTHGSNDEYTQHTLHKAAKQSYKAPPSSPGWPNMEQDLPFRRSTTEYGDILPLADSSTVDVAAIVGIEADTPPDTDNYWRMGYTYPVQLTNWAFAMAPHHPVASKYIAEVQKRMKDNAKNLSNVDPLLMGGPPVLTKVIKEYTEADEQDFKWESVSGLHDPAGGRGKVVAGDILVLPITGFSPGRGRLHNMGSQPVTHANARLSHFAQGSWRKKSFHVEAGKLCRTMLGRCRDWSKIP